MVMNGKGHRVECTCYIKEEDGVEPQIIKCSLCEAAPELYEELVEADEVICSLCKRLNPQHETADYGKGCKWCQDRDSRLKAIAKVEGGK